MENEKVKNTNCVEITDEDVMEAFEEHKTFIDISIGDFMKIYRHAHNLAVERVYSVTVGEVMPEKFISVSEDSDIHSAMNLLADNGLTCAAVVNNENFVTGFVSDADILTSAGVVKKHTFRDIVRHLIGEPTPREHRTIDSNNIKDIMASPAITVTAGMSIKKAAEILNEKRIKRMPVIGEDGKLAGIISMTDIIKYLGKDKNILK
jgi:CBS-domain-containing membrane protein